MDWQFPNGKMLRLIRGDITIIRVDAMVNAANSPCVAEAVWTGRFIGWAAPRS